MNVCQQCDRSFTRNCRLREHMAKVHQSQAGAGLVLLGKDYRNEYDRILENDQVNDAYNGNTSEDNNMDEEECSNDSESENDANTDITSVDQAKHDSTNDDYAYAPLMTAFRRKALDNVKKEYNNKFEQYFDDGLTVEEACVKATNKVMPDARRHAKISLVKFHEAMQQAKSDDYYRTIERETDELIFQQHMNDVQAWNQVVEEKSYVFKLLLPDKCPDDTEESHDWL